MFFYSNLFHICVCVCIYLCIYMCTMLLVQNDHLHSDNIFNHPTKTGRLTTTLRQAYISYWTKLEPPNIYSLFSLKKIVDVVFYVDLRLWYCGVTWLWEWPQTLGTWQWNTVSVFMHICMPTCTCAALLISHGYLHNDSIFNHSRDR